jgi:FkbM family methyltransferase
VRKTGYDISKYNYDIAKYNFEIELIKPTLTLHPLIKRKQLLSKYKINTVFDVGANIGQYAEQLRNIGYRGKIISFEPLNSAYSELVKRAQSDLEWETWNIALGSEDGISQINVAGNSQSSSILDMLPSHLQSAPNSKYIETQEIKIKKLDSVFDEITNNNQGCGNIYLKLDVQGFEKNVIEGAAESLKKINILQLELSLLP